ncbi:hypothetical protein CHL78_007915 [Romboutsia weinsteinii]|uniref:Uncharacterized protein n=1 Tax=Romboutsia weinsteinii TaxID=2020949 RepID=A0A371J555_9FIRM|nr:hypothetical protein [Romboutsia weinsteinii]RDY27920.1 hypothetical protein CHL78_007915 [Romboutsia weinsteinii]
MMKVKQGQGKANLLYVAKLTRSIKTELLEVQNLDGNKTEYKETEVVVDIEISPSKVQLVKKYFNLNYHQESIGVLISLKKL